MIFLGKRPKKWWFLFAFTISDFQESERLCNSSGRFNSMEGDSGISPPDAWVSSTEQVKFKESLGGDEQRGKIGLIWLRRRERR